MHTIQEEEHKLEPSRWYLEACIQSDDQQTLLPLADFPVVLGRDETLAETIDSPFISRRHATVSIRDGELAIEDLGSSNGTYVNQSQIKDRTAIKHGDVIHLGAIPFRLIDSEKTPLSNLQPIGNSPSASKEDETVFFNIGDSCPIDLGDHISKLIDQRQVHVAFQAIYSSLDLKPCAYEALGRGTSDNAPKDPDSLFKIARQFDLATTLSALLRRQAVQDAVTHNLKGQIFLKTHPSELDDVDRLMNSLSQLRSEFTAFMPLVLEVNESAVTNVEPVFELKKHLDKLHIDLVFDDFGVGKSRLIALAEARPTVVKFNNNLTASVTKSDDVQLEFLHNLKVTAEELNIKTLVSRISTEAHFWKCREIGFDLYQGFYFAKPHRPVLK